MFIGDVLQPKISKFPFFPVSARRTDSKGNFIGIAEVAVLPKAFESFFEHLASTTSASFALIRDDGVVLARYPLADRPNIQLDASTGFGKLIAQNPQGGRYTTVSGVDKIERRFAVKKLEGYPLYVSSSLEISSIRSDWIKLMETHLIFGIPATLLLVTLAVFTLLRTKEFYAEAERREAAELTLRQSQKMDAVGQLTGGVSHDFNNLLTIITGNLQLALRDVTDGRLQRRLTAALAGADRAAQLTRKLLAFARNQPLDPKPLDVNQLVNGMSEMLTRTLGENISIETVGSAGLWQTEVDSSELESAILNLAINARDAIKDGGKLTIETANTFLDENYCRDFDDIKPGQYVLISVSDTGAGMPKEVADRAFDPFFTTKAPGVGTGLGLSQVYGFVRQSGGHIRIYSELNLGTTVKIYLPRSMKTAPAPTVEEERAPQGSQELILVVEDDAAVRSYVVEALADLNYKVVQAENAEKALVVLEASKPVQLMLTDVVMPGLNGRALADAARGLQPGLKVLFMTGYSRNAIVHHGRLDPGVALIQKPFSQATLATRIRGVLDS
jgi:two-component system NtrC family sensor kinase